MKISIRILKGALINSDQFSLDGDNVYPYEAAEASEYIPKYKFEILDELGINEKFAPNLTTNKFNFLKILLLKTRFQKVYFFRGSRS